MAERVVSFEQALAEVLAHSRSVAHVGEVETVHLTQAAGRTLAAPLTADRDQPPFDRSTRDGFALRSQDAAGDLRITGSVRAGQHWEGPPLAEGEAVEIMTGAALPAGADAVVMVEHVTVSDDLLHLDPGRSLRAGENVVRRGAEALNGSVVLPAGRVLAPAEIAVAAACGASRIAVFRQPVAAIIATGDELVELDQPIDTGQIRNSNSYALQALVHADGGIGQRLDIARDTLGQLRERIAQGRRSDLLLLSGGVSMGKYDLVEHALLEAGAEFFFTGALIQPGKPVVFGRLPKPDLQGWTYFFGLPGNPISTQVCFHLFVAPMLRALGGRAAIEPRFVEARLAEELQGGARVTRFLPAELTGGWDRVTVQAVSWQGSGDVAANARGDCYVVLPAGVEVFHAGETVRVLLR
jgi:molybdopterin molybdotransferase